MLTPFEIEQRLQARALQAQALKAQAVPPTPGHSAAAAANDFAGRTREAAEAERRRGRVQHEADPRPEADDDGDAPEMVRPDVDKRFRQAFEVEVPAGYPALGMVSPETFRRGVITGGEAAVSPGYMAPARPVPVPVATVNAAAICRPLLTDGRARPGAGE